MANWAGWSFGGRGAQNSARGEYHIVTIAIVGKVGDTAESKSAIQQGIISIKTTDGTPVVETGSLGTLGELQSQAESFLSKADRRHKEWRQRRMSAFQNPNADLGHDPNGMGGE